MRFLSLTFLLFVLYGCGYPTHKDPPILLFDSEQAAFEEASSYAREIDASLFQVSSKSGSMNPILITGDFIVVDHLDFSSIEMGQIITYRAEWAKASAPPVTHRALLRDNYGILVGGDNVDGQHPENKWRVNERNYVGVVMGVYRGKRE